MKLNYGDKATLIGTYDVITTLARADWNKVLGEVIQVVPTFSQEYRRPLLIQSLDHIVED